MFERDRTYPAAITGHAGTDATVAQRDAVRWVIERHRDLGGQILVYVPTKQTLDAVAGPLATLAAASGVVVAGWRGTISGWTGGVVLAAWPDRAHLAAVADNSRTRALCVIPHDATEASAWAHAARPELLGNAIPGAQPAQLDPVVRVGLAQLTARVNHANNLAGALDRRDAVAVLRVLHAANYPLPAEDVYAWALAHGWPARGAERLREMAAKIDAGRSLQLKGPWPFTPDILERWRSSASSAESGHQ
jgi:hypothetical protein